MAVAIFARREKQPTNANKDKKQKGAAHPVAPVNAAVPSDASRTLLVNSAGRKKPKTHWGELLDMYDMIIANLTEKGAIIEPSITLKNDQLAIGFSNLSSETQISKYFIISKFPDYLKTEFFDTIRRRCIRDGLKINFFVYGEPHHIAWDSHEMKSRMATMKDYAKSTNTNVDVFEYRSKRSDVQARMRILNSTKYFNQAELDYKRSLMKVNFLIEISAKRDDDSILNMISAIEELKTTCKQSDIRLRELKVNIMDWLQVLGIFHLNGPKETQRKLVKRIMTDDNMAMFNGYKQGRVGYNGVCLGMDVLSNLPVMRKFKADPDAAENWLISAATGGGKSYFVKTLLTYLLADKFVVTVMDYEGDEYNNLANFIRAANPNDVRIVSMGKRSTYYFDPMEIPELTGDNDVDDTLKDDAIQYTMSVFRIVLAGLDGELTTWEESVLSMAISRVYDMYGVTEDKNTWIRSKGLRIHEVYEAVCHMAETKELVDEDSDNVKYKAAIKIAQAARVYFIEGEAKSGTFKNAMSVNELFGAKMIVFSFGLRGGSEIQVDPVSLALKQLSVANLATQISNHCKYVKHCFNVKVWEEYQRWGAAKGSAEIICNAMTGGRKRGDVNFLITNDLSAILDKTNRVALTLSQNIQNYAIGYIKSKQIRQQFCKEYDLMECEGILMQIAKTHATEEARKSEATTTRATSSGRYKHAFCVVLDSGKRAVVRVKLPRSLADSTIFKTGVILKNSSLETN
jgi:hypothetical protein